MSELIDRLKKKYLQEEEKENIRSNLINAPVQKRVEYIRNNASAQRKNNNEKKETSKTGEEEKKINRERAESIISNRNNNKFTSARTNFQTQNKEELATAKKADVGENTFSNFVSNIKENPHSVAKVISDVASSFQANRINSGVATEREKRNYEYLNVMQGLHDNTVGISSLLINPIAEVEKAIGKTFNNKELYNHGNTWQNTMKAISEINNYGNKVNNKIENEAYRTTGNVSRTVANMLPSIALSGLTGGMSGLGKVGTFLAKNSGALLQAASVAGNETTSTLNEDNSNFGQALATGILKGGVEYGTEKLFGGNIIAKGTSIDNLVSKGISSKVKSKVGQFLTSKGYEFAGEQIEELIADNAGYVIDKMINNKDMPDFNEWLQNTGETAKTTFLTSLVLQSLGLGGGTYNEVQELNLDKQQEQEMNKWLNEAQNIINNANNTQAQQTTQPQNKTAQNQTSEQMDSMLNNKQLPQPSYEYEKSDNARINSLRQDANKYFNNSDKARNYINMLEKIVTDKDIEIRFDGNLKTTDGKVANGSYSNGVITINPNSTRAGEFIAIHELTHAIGTKEMLNMVENYRKSNIEFDNAVKGLLKNYNKTEITGEALSDVSAQLFGNQEFVNNLAQNNTNIFKKIYSEIKYLWHQFRGYKNQNQFVEDLYYKWTQAYKSNNKLNQTSNYLKKITNSGIKYTELDGKLFKNADGTLKTPREAYNSMVGQTLQLEDGSNVKLVKKLPGNKDIYNELIKRQPRSKNINEIKNINNQINGNIDEILEQSDFINNKADVDNRHKDNDIISFDTREARIYDGNQAYKLTLSIAELSSGEKVGYAKKFLRPDNQLTQEIKKEVSTSSTSKTGRSSRMTTSNNSITSQNQDVNTTTQYSMQNEQNNAWQSYLDKNYKPKGTITNMQDIKLPLPENKTPKQDNNSEGTFTETEEKLAEVLQESPVPEKKKSRVWAIAKANLIDKGIVFEELSQKANNRDLQGKWDYTLTAISRGQNAIGRARYEFDAKTKQEKIISKSLTDIKAKVGDNVQDFSLYLYHKHNIDRMSLESKAQKQMQELKKEELKDYDNQAIEKLSRKRITDKTDENKAKEINSAKEYMRLSEVKNKPVFGQVMTAEMSQGVVDKYEKSNPEFKTWAQDVYDYNNANKQELVNNGVISQELADKLNEMYPHYVPISRVDKQGSAIKVALDTNRTGINTPIARATGGNSDILPLFDTLAKRTLQTYNASARNNFGVELKNTLKGKQETETADMDNILDDIGEEHQELLKEGKDGKAPTFTVFDKGEKITFEITQDMYDALKPLSDSSLLSKTIRSLNKINNFRRAVLTEYNPVFILTNPIKDTQDILFNSQHPLKTYSKIPESVAQIKQKGYWYKEYIQNGGEQNTYFNSQDNKFESERKKHPLKKAITFPLDAISTVNKTIEMAPRLAEYIASRETGRSIETSMLDAARVTTNFKAGGDVTKFANRNGATFLNASVQGAMQQVRNIKEANVKGAKGYAVLASKYIIAGLPAILLNNLIWGDDEEYEELQDYVKDNYYVIAKYGDGKFIRIPKGRTVAVVQKLMTDVSEYITGDKELNIDNFVGDFWENILFAVDNIAPNNPLDNNILSPIIQVAQNKSWYGEDIVPTRLQDKPVTEQYDETIDSFSIWLGQKINQSPYKINYLLDQYGGGASDILLPTMTKQAENNVFEDKFTTDAVMKNKYAGEFYEKLDEVTVNANADKATDNDVLKYKYASQVSSQMSELYKEKREVQSSDLSDEEKKAKIKEIQKKINNIAEEGLSSMEEIKISGNTAIIGENEYYKVTNVKDNTKEWKKLSDEEKEKNKSISLKTYANYKEAVAQETIAQRKNGTIDEDESLKTKDKINILINANYSNKEKIALYENYIGTEDTTYQIMKNTGINITEYLKYKMQDFSSDKQDDGTIDGKTVSGSAKKKTYEYVNKMNITYNQKLLLLGMKYSLTDTEKNKLAYYVNDMKITKAEKLEIYGKLKGFTVYKNGRVTW